MEILPKKEKSQSNKTLPLLPGLNTPDCTGKSTYPSLYYRIHPTEVNGAEKPTWSISSEAPLLCCHLSYDKQRFAYLKECEFFPTVIEEYDEQIEDMDLMEEAIEEEVTERINRLLIYSSDAPGSRLCQVLATVGKAMKTHLKYVIEYQKPHYPEEYDVCNTYAQKYHRRLQYEISVRTEYELPINVIHCVLSWIKTTYPK